jgi:hypothetical protein
LMRIWGGIHLYLCSCYLFHGLICWKKNCIFLLSLAGFLNSNITNVVYLLFCFYVFSVTLKLFNMDSFSSVLR